MFKEGQINNPDSWGDDYMQLEFILNNDLEQALLSDGLSSSHGKF